MKSTLVLVFLAVLHATLVSAELPLATFGYDGHDALMLPSLQVGGCDSDPLGARLVRRPRISLCKRGVEPTQPCRACIEGCVAHGLPLSLLCNARCAAGVCVFKQCRAA